jgi:hypothetical protein
MPVTHLLADGDNLRSRQCGGVERPDLAIFAGLEHAVEDAAMIVGMTVERRTEKS